jgi:hypothetical protein
VRMVARSAALSVPLAPSTPRLMACLQSRNHRVQVGIRTLNFALDAADAALELVVLGSSARILD